MSIESGKDGKILIGTTSVAEITGWEFVKEVETTRFASSATGGYRATLAGVKMGTGTIDFKWSTSAASPIAEGTSVTLLLHLNATKVFTVPAVIKSFRVKVDIDGGDVTAGRATFETNGPWTEPVP